MSNSDGTWRSNHFTVRDLGDFEAWVVDIGADYDQIADGRVVFFDVSGTGLFPAERADEEGFGVDVEFFAELNRHLAPDPENVCVLMQVRKPAHGTIIGKAFALRAAELGEPSVVVIDLYDIYGRAREAFGLEDQPEPV